MTIAVFCFAMKGLNYQDIDWRGMSTDKLIQEISTSFSKGRGMLPLIGPNHWQLHFPYNPPQAIGRQTA